MESTLILQSHLQLSFGPTLEHGKKITLWVESTVHPNQGPVRFIVDSQKISTLVKHSQEVIKYSGNANEAITMLEGKYCCQECFIKRLPPRFLEGILTEEHYCDYCELT